MPRRRDQRPASPWPNGLWLLACLLACLAALPGRAAETGLPSVSAYQPRDYGAQSQNWAIVQDLRGLMYVGNGEGVLEFDGVRWRLIPTPNRTPVRSLAMDADGRIYVGAVGEVGYLAPDAGGQMRYVSLNARLESAHTRFAEVWRIHPTSAGVYFFTRECIFLITKEGLHSWQTERPLHNAYGVGERFFVQEMDVGLLELDSQGLKALPWGARFKQDKVYCLLPWAGQLLIGTRTSGLFLCDGTRLTPFPTEADAYLKEHLLYQGALLPDGTLALATLEGGTVLLSRAGKIQLILDPRAGLPDRTVYCLCPDRQGGLWMGLGHGLARLQWPAPFTRFGVANGLKGTVLAIHRQGGTLYAGTSMGLYRLEAPTRGGTAAFKQIPGLKSQTWAICPTDQGVLAGNYQGLFEVRSGQARAVPGVDATVLAIHRGARDGQLYLGLEGGLARLHRAGPGSPWVNEGRFPGLLESVYSIEEDEDGRLWLGAMGGEVLRVGLPTQGEHTQPMVERFGEAQGLPAQRQVDVARVGGGIVFATNAGVYQFDEASRHFRPDPRFARGFPAGPRRVLLLKEQDGGRVWMETQDELSSLRALALGTLGPDGTFTWEQAPFIRFGAMELDAISPDADGKVWLGGVEGLFRYDPAVPTAAAQVFAAHVRSAAAEGGNGLRLEFSATSFDSGWNNLYQIRLDGRDRDWSPWSPTAFKEYSYLPPRAYVFRVRARNASGAVSREDSWAFVIRPPWYASSWGRGLFALLAVAGILAGWAALRRFLQAQARAIQGVREELRASKEDKNKFIGMVGHDLRNPLNGIMLAAELLEDAAQEPSINRTASQIRNECRNMDGLIGRFLDMAAIEAGTLMPSPSVCPLGDLVRQTVERHEARAMKKGIRLELDLEPLAGPAFTDAKFAQEILDSLVSNAVTFSPTGTTVTLRLRREGDRLLLTVQDQGPGFTPEDLTRLYRPFTRLSARPTGHEKPVGLGLAIVKHMVDAQGGALTLTTAPGQGAAFQVTFPVAR